jgi:hypothetical protein
LLFQALDHSPLTRKVMPRRSYFSTLGGKLLLANLEGDRTLPRWPVSFSSK